MKTKTTTGNKKELEKISDEVAEEIVESTTEIVSNAFTKNKDKGLDLYQFADECIDKAVFKLGRGQGIG